MLLIVYYTIRGLCKPRTGPFIRPRLVQETNCSYKWFTAWFAANQAQRWRILLWCLVLRSGCHDYLNYVIRCRKIRNMTDAILSEERDETRQKTPASSRKRNVWSSKEEEQLLVICQQLEIAEQLDICVTSAGGSSVPSAIQIQIHWKLLEPLFPILAIFYK